MKWWGRKTERLGDGRRPTSQGTNAQALPCTRCFWDRRGGEWGASCNWCAYTCAYTRTHRASRGRTHANGPRHCPSDSAGSRTKQN